MAKHAIVWQLKLNLVQFIKWFRHPRSFMSEI